CLDHVIQNCSAPCIGKISRAGYAERVKQACDFLEGHTLEMRESLKEQMKKAADRRDFEKAASLRNLLDDLKKTTRPARKFFRSLPSTVVPERELEALRDVLRLPAVPARIECFDISNISDTHSVASMVVFRNGRPSKPAYRRYRIQGVEGQDDVGCMAEVIRRRCRRLKAEGVQPPDLLVVDGGKGQLASLQPRPFLARPEYPEPLGPEPIRQSGTQRRLRPHHHQARLFLGRPGHQALLVRRGQRKIFPHLGRAGVTRGKPDFPDSRIPGKRPTEGMLPSPAPHDQNCVLASHAAFLFPKPPLPEKKTLCVYALPCLSTPPAFTNNYRRK
ncbi:MAG: hypothetical protein EB079_07835, partial [Verrucomicrobia bacterium]|nr:hypothetical protein [Verrucomicrobiota bacterium]